MKRKLYKYATSVALVILVLFAVISPVTAFAGESDMANANTEDGTSAAEDSVEDASSDEADTNESSFEDGFFPSLFAAFEEHLSEILSALTFIGSLIIMLCYKKGFLPLVTDGLGALKQGVKTINEKTGELSFGTEALSEAITEKLDAAENLLKGTCDMLAGLEVRLAELEGERNERKITNTVLSAEVDMLYEIFMSAALPQYLKDNVGERIAMMKAALAEDEPNE